ncbi:hypothetical protein B0H13DRAFT_2331099 [Mycena leptocephala]|nr:hypothetical protein B0H13DRAFT_2331099 [Mycena leptocephala]
MLKILTFAALIWGRPLLLPPASLRSPPSAISSQPQWSVDPTYPDVPEFTPVVGVPELSTVAPTLQDATTQWFLVPNNNNTFKIQSVLVPDKFVSYVAIGVPATSAIHSQIVLRGSANAALFSLQPISNLQSVNIIVPAISKLVTSWKSALADPATPVTLANQQVGAVGQTQSFLIAIIGKVMAEGHAM